MTQQLSQKDVMYITDHLEIEQQQVQSFTDAANECTDPQAKQIFQDIANMHQRHFDTLKRHLGGQMMS
ncbi:MAG: spore coat protein [Bacillota bacterium]|jgi:rubrerythrin|nr:spore coat protein [Clostridia bacterium]